MWPASSQSHDGFYSACHVLAELALQPLGLPWRLRGFKVTQEVGDLLEIQFQCLHREGDGAHSLDEMPVRAVNGSRNVF